MIIHFIKQQQQLNFINLLAAAALARANKAYPSPQLPEWTTLAVDLFRLGNRFERGDWRTQTGARRDKGDKSSPLERQRKGDDEPQGARGRCEPDRRGSGEELLLYLIISLSLARSTYLFGSRREIK